MLAAAVLCDSEWQVCGKSLQEEIEVSWFQFANHNVFMFSYTRTRCYRQPLLISSRVHTVLVSLVNGQLKV